MSVIAATPLTRNMSHSVRDWSYTQSLYHQKKWYVCILNAEFLTDWLLKTGAKWLFFCGSETLPVLHGFNGDNYREKED